LNNPLKLRLLKNELAKDVDVQESHVKAVQNVVKSSQHKRSHLGSLMNNLDIAEKQEQQAFKVEKKEAFEESQREFDRKRERLLNRAKGSAFLPNAKL